MSFSYKYVVQFRDTDAAGVVYFANILSICHVAYEASLIESSVNLQLFVDNPNFAVPIIHVSAEFYKPLFCGDRVIIELTPRSIDIYKFEIKYQILATDLSVLATAITKHIVIAPQTRKRKELPAALNEWLIQWGEN